MLTKNVVFIRSALLGRDIRIKKEIESLRKDGYYSLLVCWDRDFKSPKYDLPNDTSEIKLKLAAPWGILILPILPIWWCFVFFSLLMRNWDIAHAVNLDCIVPTIIAGKLKRKPVIYEILDIYEDQITLGHKIRALIMRLDKLFMRTASAVIVADDAQIEGICGIPNDLIVTIYDSPNIALKEETYNTISRHAPFFTLFYAGAFYKNRRLNLDKIIVAIKHIDNVKLIIAGYGDLLDQIIYWSEIMPQKIEFVGKKSYNDVLKLGRDSDLFFILRDPIVPANRYTCGSTLFNAMLCGKPILASKGSSTATKIQEHNCGIVVDSNNLDEIRNAILTLKNDSLLCNTLGANARCVYEQKFSWALMEQRLRRLYSTLVN